MDLDIKRAFCSMFSNFKWLQSIAIWCLLFWIGQKIFELPTIMPHKVFTFIIDSFIACVFNGYLIQTIHNEINNENNLPPEWSNYLKFFKNGLFAILSIILHMIIYYFLFLAFLYTLQKYIVSIMLQFMDFMSIMTIEISSFMIIFCSIIIPYVFMIFALNFNIKDCFKINYLILPLRKALSELSVSIVISFILIGIYMYLTLSMLKIDFNHPNPITILTFPICLIIYNLYAQTYKIALNRI